ncbi:MAG: right-handed parallel beta-helix repeat-containing protein [Candidatus Thorarchaeota archaeon]|jgi:parallel beta-helix repeat protein
MVKVTHIVIIILAGLLLLASANSATNSEITDSNNVATIETGITSSYETHSPISITNDDQFNSTALAEGWSGNGTYHDPFIIEGYEISSSGYCIYISDVSSYFIIRNCQLYSQNSGGVYFWSIERGTIESCIIFTQYFGIIASYSNNCTLYNNTISALEGALLFDSSQNLNVTNNRMYNSSVFIFGYSPFEWIHDFENNTVNNEPLGYFMGISDTTIDGSSYAQIILGNCENVIVENGVFHDIGIGVLLGFSENCTIRRVTVYNAAEGISAHFSNETKIINNTVFDCTQWGIHVNMSSRGSILNNEVHNTGWSGILVGEGEHTTIEGNIISSVESGIMAYLCFSSIISDNTLYNNNYGIELYEHDNSTVTFNLVYNSQEIGISVGYGDLSHFYANEIYGNNKDANDDGGTNFWDDGVSVGNMWGSYNGSGWYYIPGSSGSIDHYPTAIDVPGFPTIDHPEDISMIEGTTGNFISWHPLDQNPSFYEIYKDGSIHRVGMWNTSTETISVNLDFLSEGYYSFMVKVGNTGARNTTDSVMVNVVPDIFPPIIDHPANVTYVLGEEGNFISWHPFDNLPYFYMVWKTDIFVQGGFWNSSSEIISVNVDGLGLGEHSYSIAVTDTSGNNATDTVHVIVTLSPGTTPPPNPELVQLVMNVITYGSLVIIVVFVVLIVRGRNQGYAYG